MIFIFPLIPIIAAIVLIALGTATAVTSNITANMEIITTIIVVLIVFLSVVFVICNLLRKSSFGDKVAGITIMVISTALVAFESYIFFMALIECDTSGIGGTIEFIIRIVVGGSLWLGGVGFSTFANYNIVRDYEGEGYTRYIRVIMCVIISGILTGGLAWLSY